MKLIGNNNEKKYEIGNFSEELNRRAEKIKNTNLETNVSNFNEKPTIKLKKVENLVIEIKSQNDHDFIMKIYESANWKCDFNNLPTKRNYAKGEMVEVGNIFSFFNKKYILSQGYKQIDVPDFCKLQKIPINKIIEINKWYDANKPDRESKR